MDFDQHEREIWAGRATAYERSFAGLCAHAAPPLVAAVAAGPGVRLLDVGTGPGTVAALAVALGADVDAVDAEPSMVALAAERVPQATVRPGILPDLPFVDATFDAVVANFVINHVADPAAAVAELARVGRAGARVAITVWPTPSGLSSGQLTAQSLWVQAMDAAGVDRPVMPKVAVDRDFARTPDGLTQLLELGGLAAVACQRIEFTHHVDPDEWWAGAMNGIGSAGYVIARLPADRVKQVKVHFERISQPLRTADGHLALPTAALLAHGKVPGTADRQAHGQVRPSNGKRAS